ncbi:hypothetical protein DC522_33745, partial [Microvirga sp. KLBC 81]
SSWLWLRMLQPWQLGAAGGASTPLYLWRVVDSEGEILDILVQPRRDKAAAVKFMRKLLKKRASPRVFW